MGVGPARSIGGSGAGTPALVEALGQRFQALDHPPALELVLHGRDAGKLALVEAACRARAEGREWLQIGAITSRQQALEGATLVLNQVRVGGLRARSFDESFPRALGLPGEETLGPGGFANACRTLPVALELFRDVARFAPAATTINLTNPASMVQQAAERYVGNRVLSVCDSPVNLVRTMGQQAGAPDAEGQYLGMNHCGWVTSLRHDGADLLPPLLARPEGVPGLGIEPRLVAELGAVPGPYLRYYYHPDRMLAAQQGKPTRAEALLALEAELLASYTRQSMEQPSVLGRRGAVWYDLAVVPTIEALLGDPPRRLIANVRNGGQLPYLPPETVVELTAEVGRDRARPLPPPALPPDARGLLAANAAYECLAVQGIVERSEPLLRRALLANPMVGSYDRAAAVLDAIRAGAPASG
jgi:6-phospho-beta-glucosidase